MGGQDSAFGLCGSWASKILDLHIVTVQLKYSQVQTPWGQEPSHRSQHLDLFAIQSDLTPGGTEQEAKFLLPVSLHKWCGCRLWVLITSTNLPIDARLHMWLFFLIATVMFQTVGGAVGLLRRVSPCVTGSTSHLPNPLVQCDLSLHFLKIFGVPSCLNLLWNCLLFWEGISLSGTTDNGWRQITLISVSVTDFFPHMSFNESNILAENESWEMNF